MGERTQAALDKKKTSARKTASSRIGAAAGALMTFGSVLTTGGCAEMLDNTPAIIAELNPTQQNNLKVTALKTFETAFSGYTVKETNSVPKELSTFRQTVIPHLTGKISGHPVEYISNSGTTAKLQTGANGSEVEVIRASISFCHDNVTEQLAVKGDCELDNNKGIDTGYRAIFTNPDMNAIDESKGLTLKDVELFVNSPTTWLSTVGDSYKMTVYNITPDGKVTDGDNYSYRNAKTQEGVVRQVSDAARGIMSA